eukprot:353794-Chlamydomonas_euryale.AAC.10
MGQHLTLNLTKPRAQVPATRTIGAHLGPDCGAQAAKDASAIARAQCCAARAAHAHAHAQLRPPCPSLQPSS